MATIENLDHTASPALLFDADAIEHNLDLIRQADWVVDLGPDAGDEGGQLVAEGPPEEIEKNKRSKTGQALRG